MVRGIFIRSSIYIPTGVVFRVGGQVAISATSAVPYDLWRYHSFIGRSRMAAYID
jgi:hypothetical protein